jgi:hypothetical protein
MTDKIKNKAKLLLQTRLNRSGFIVNDSDEIQKIYDEITSSEALYEAFLKNPLKYFAKYDVDLDEHFLEVISAAGNSNIPSMMGPNQSYAYYTPQGNISRENISFIMDPIDQQQAPPPPWVNLTSVAEVDIAHQLNLGEAGFINNENVASEENTNPTNENVTQTSAVTRERK